VAAVASLSSATAFGGSPSRERGADAPQVKDEVVVTAARQSDAVLAAKVTAAVQQDPYIFGDHITVSAENGVVRLEGVVNDLGDLYRALRLARRIAGKGRVVNSLEFQPLAADHD
jgi:osmotically-inducible protein OsmY